MGTTMTALVVRRRPAAADRPRRRLARRTCSTKARSRRITDDHSLVEELVREGRLTPEQAESHPQRARRHARARRRRRGRGRPLHASTSTAGDRVVLCSDGLTTMVRERDVERIARSEPDPQRAAEQLVDAANAAGGEDNTSVVVVDVLEVDPRRACPIADELVAGTARRPRPAPMPPAPEYREPVAKEPRPRRGGAASAARCCCSSRSILVLAIAVGGVGWYAAPVVLRRLRGQPRRDLQGRAGRRARLGPDDRRRRTGLTARRSSRRSTATASRRARRAARSTTRSASSPGSRPNVAATSTTTTTTTTQPARTTTTARRGPPSTRAAAAAADDGPRARSPARRRRSELSLGLLVVDHRRSAATSSSRSADGPKLPPDLYRAARLGRSASTSSRTSRSAASRRSPTRPCSRSRRCSTASAS